MKLGRILFASDYSRTGDLAFALAASIARHAGAELLVVHVEQASNEYGGEHYHGTANPTTDVLRRELERLAPASSQVPCSYHLLAGKPAKAIVDFASHQNVDLIVMSTHGCTGIASVIVGSVAEEVIRTASCPVLAVKTVSEQEMYGIECKVEDQPRIGLKQQLQTLGNLVEVCVDSARGLQAAADDVKHGGLKVLLSDRAEQRGDFAEELQAEAVTRGAVPILRGTLLGRIFRQWIHLSKALGDDATVLNACLKEEEHTLKEYGKALGLGLPEGTRRLLQRQLAEIRLLDRALLGIKEAGVLEINVTPSVR